MRAFHQRLSRSIVQVAKACNFLLYWSQVPRAVRASVRISPDSDVKKYMEKQSTTVGYVRKLKTALGFKKGQVTTHAILEWRSRMPATLITGPLCKEASLFRIKALLVCSKDCLRLRNSWLWFKSFLQLEWKTEGKPTPQLNALLLSPLPYPISTYLSFN
jgi:hypothetical protein